MDNFNHKHLEKSDVGHCSKKAVPVRIILFFNEFLGGTYLMH